MAVALDMADHVLDIFSRFKRTEMTLIELHKSLSTSSNRLTMDEVLRLVRLPNLVNLFSLQTLSKDLCLIRFTPKLTLCEACLQKGCKNKGNCTKLHLCRYPSHFTDKPLDKPCRFPHKLSEYPNNVLLLRRYELTTLNEDLLLDLLRLHYTQSQIEYQNHPLLSTPTPNRSPSQSKNSLIPPDNPLERQIDVSIPCERDASDIDLEIVQLLLATKDIIVEPILNKQISTEFSRRFTLQFPNKQLLENLLTNESIIIYNQIPIKFKRTQRRRDTKIVALKFSTNEKIDSLRLNLYVETLIGKNTSNLFDMTPDDHHHERIYLIRSEQSIDFEHLYKVYSAKNTLQGHRVTIAEVYECETLQISFARQSMNLSRLRQIIGEQRWQEEVFACLAIRQQQIAEIELMNTEITTKWLSQAHQFERDVGLLIQPVIDFIPTIEPVHEEDDKEISDLLSRPKQSPNSVNNEEQQAENSTVQYVVKPDWRIVLTHPVFGEEYRKYIHENLNISVYIVGSSIEVANETIRKELARFTNMFIQTFVFQEITDPDKAQVKLIKQNYSRMAHKWIKGTNRTLLAARRNVMNELFPRPSSTTQQQPNKPSPTPTFRQKQSQVPRKFDSPPTPLLPSPSSPKPTPTTTTDSLPVLSYTIENEVYLPFFSPSSPFPTRLFNYLSNTFNVTLKIKTTSTTKITLELKGQHQDTAEVRPALSSLFTSLQSKTYSPTSESCQFSIPDFHHVAQTHLNQNDLIASCSFSSKNTGLLTVRYFANNPHFGIDEDKLDKILLHQLCGRSFPVLILTKNFEKSFQILGNQIEKRSDYRQDICYSYDTEKKPLSIDLGGTKAIVQKLSQEIQQIHEQYTPVPCPIRLLPLEVDFLLKVCSNDLNKCEKQYENDGVDLRGALKNRESIEFRAPKYLHEKIKLFLLELSRIESISEEFLCQSQLIEKKKQEINNLASKHRCLINIKLSSSLESTAAPKTSSDAIRISNGDLTTEKADVLVVCSTSGQLRVAMINAAGAQVMQELAGEDLGKTAVETSAGQLKQAKRLLFIPWTPPSTNFTIQNIPALRQSINEFVAYAVKYTINKKFQSLAFPAIGCGGFGIPPDVIATIMIDAVHNQLSSNVNSQLTVTFVIQQQNVYDIFQAKLKPSSTTHRHRSRSPERSPKLDRVNIILTTASANLDTARNVLKLYQQMLNP